MKNKIKMKTLIALLLSLLVIASFAHPKQAATAQEATVESETGTESVTEETTEVEAAAGDVEEDHAEEAANNESETPAGSALLMLLLGIGTVALVGGLNLFRRGNQPPTS